MAVSPDQFFLATAGADMIIRLWRLPQSLQAVPQFAQTDIKLSAHTGRVNCLSFSPYTKRHKRGILASGGDDCWIMLWSVCGGAPISRLRPPVSNPESSTLAVYALAFSGDGALLAAGVADGCVFLWNAAAFPVPLLLRVLRGHVDHVTALAFLEDSAADCEADCARDAARFLCSGGGDGRVWLWDIDADSDGRADRACAAGDEHAVRCPPLERPRNHAPIVAASALWRINRGSAESKEWRFLTPPTRLSRASAQSQASRVLLGQNLLKSSYLDIETMTP